MDSELKVYRSLPPLVEGKIHGYLKLTVDEVVWSSRRSPGDVTVLASWWGEIDSAQFRFFPNLFIIVSINNNDNLFAKSTSVIEVKALIRLDSTVPCSNIYKNRLTSNASFSSVFRPLDFRTGLPRLDRETTETYAVRTSVDLFVEYLRNCESIELVVVREETRLVVGTSHVVDLLDVIESKNYSRYFPILNEAGNRLGDVHVALKYSSVKGASRSAKKNRDSVKTGFSYPDINVNSKYNGKMVIDNKSNNIFASTNPTKFEDNFYKSVLKEKRTRGDDPGKQFNMEVADKIVAQVVARAQRLRGAILKESYEDDPLALSENSALDSSRSDSEADNEAKLYEYFLGAFKFDLKIDGI